LIPHPPRHVIPMKTSVREVVVEGIAYTVYRSEEGSVVDSPCQCFGHPHRTHSTPDCPWMAKRRRQSRRKRDA